MYIAQEGFRLTHNKMHRFRIFVYIQLLNTTVIHVANANFEFDYSASSENSCHTVKDRFQFIIETTISRCVEECAARKHCLALNFWSRSHICELFTTSEEEDPIRGDCFYVKKDDIRVKKTPCQPECDYGKVCVVNKSGLGECKVKECINITGVVNGVVLGNRRDVGAKIRYKCNYGYRSNDSMEAECLDTGEFSNTAACGRGVFFEPDFVSPWHEITAKKNDETGTFLSVSHGLGETPLLVDVQVKVETGENAGFIFQGTGCPPRDNDESKKYGGIAYIYNDEYVKVSSSTSGTEDTRANCVYTGTTPFWEGPNSSESVGAKVRVRAWKKSSLPTPSYTASRIPIKAGKSDNSYVEKRHGIDGYPAFVISRTKFPLSSTNHPGYYSDSVGAAPVMYIGITHRTNGYVIYGYNERMIRAWAPTNSGDKVFSGDDGWNFSNETQGELEFYAWSETLLTPTKTGSSMLGQSVPGPNLQQNRDTTFNVDSTFTRVWVQASDGLNVGFRFIGSGSLAYEEKRYDDVCTYGGLLYAYNGSSIRYWQPGAGNGVSNGFLICIPSSMGKGSHMQGSSNGKAVYSTWTLGFK